MPRLDFASVISRFSTSERKNGQPRYRRRSSSQSAAANAVPHPYQAGSRQRFCVHANTHGIARSDARYSAPSGRREGREPMLSSASSSTGVNERKNGTRRESSTSSRYAVRERSASAA